MAFIAPSHTFLKENIEPSIYYATIVSNKVNLVWNWEDKENAVLLNDETKKLLNPLIKRSREGDTQAMGAIYQQFKTPLFGLTYRYTYDSAASEDLIQEIFLKVFTHIQELGNEEAFVGWLYRIAVNTCLSYVRSKKRLLQKTVSLSDVEGTSFEKGYIAPDRIMRKPLEEAIQSLSSKLKSVFLLHDVQGFRHEEVAEILGCSVGTSKSQLFKARMKIRKHLEGKQVL